MLQNILLEFQGDINKIHVDDISSYEGSNNLSDLIGLEGKADTRDLTLSFLGELFPQLEKLRLNNSIIPSVRDIGCYLVNLRFLSLARCGITSLDGISTISSNLEELYLAFNKITDVVDLLGMDNLKIVDLEENLLSKLDDIEVLSSSPKLKALTLVGNPAASDPNYKEKIMKLLPKLIYLDEKRIKPKRTKTPRPPALPKNPSSVTFVLDPPQEINIVPLDFSKMKENDDDEILLTEQLLDKVDERPPSSYGSFEEKVLPGFMKKSIKQPSKQTIVSNSKPKIYRPMSAKGRPIQ